MTKWIKMALCWIIHAFGISFILVSIVVTIRGGIDAVGSILCMILSTAVQLWINPKPNDWIEKEEGEE